MTTKGAKGAKGARGSLLAPLAYILAPLIGFEYRLEPGNGANQRVSATHNEIKSS